MYILQSEKADRYYIGSTSDMEKRLKHHNGPEAKWTKRYQPLKVIYTEVYSTRGEAMRREKYLKSKEGIAEKLRILDAVKCNPYG